VTTLPGKESDTCDSGTPPVTHFAQWAVAEDLAWVNGTSRRAKGLGG